jgi:L-glyceraldehyde 3-phosphate reductase
MEMEYRRIGRSGVKVSELALGSWLTYGTVTEKENALGCVKQAYELGINHFDCANVYGSVPHAAEEFLAEALAPFSRGSYVLTTKAFWPVGPGINDRGLSRKHIFAEIDKSLKALNTDYVDIFYCHRYDPNTDLEETLRALHDLVVSGKALYIGFSEWTVAQIAQALQIQKELGLHKFVISQPEYSLFNRYIEPGVLPLCEVNGIGQAVWSPLAQGILTGKYKKGQTPPAGTRAAAEKTQRPMQRYLKEEYLTKAEQLEGIAKEIGLSLPQLALAWVLRQPNLSSAIIGASRPDQVVENVKASGVTLDDEVLQKIEEVLN